MIQLMWAEPRHHDSGVERWLLRRVRTSLERQVWSTRMTFLRGAWRNLLPATILMWTVAVGLMFVHVGPPMVRYVVAGVLLASSVWIPYSVLLMRTYAGTIGSWAEEWTREVLRSRRLGWLIEEDLFLGGANIDHVAVAQDRVFVIESKYRGVSTRPDVSRHEADLRQVTVGARRVGVLLRQAGVPVGRPTPVLVVWGPGGKDLGPLAHGLVEVVAGEDLRDWCERRAVPQIVALPARTKIAAALAAQRRKHHDWQRRQPVRLMA